MVERVARGDAYGDQEIADWVRDARRLATLEHPNVARVRDVVIRGEEVLVVGEFVDGVRWSELSSITPRPSLEIALRILVDVLSGLSAVHNLRDAKREPMKLVHGELTPECVVVGPDGVARIVSTCRVRSATARPGRDGSAYLAPEVLLADESAGARADVYSVGVMLWEALSGRPLFPNTQPSAIVTHLLSGRVARPTIPEGSPWAAPLADIAARALAADPEKRFASAAALAAELRRIGGPKLAPPVRVAALVRGTFGDGIRARREALERGESPPPREEVSGVEPQPTSESELVPIEVVIPSTAPTPLPPEPGAAVEDALPAEAIKPPPVPTFRQRLPTLSGVAPPTSVEPQPAAKGTRVVVAPPTPMMAFPIPGMALARETVTTSTPAVPERSTAPRVPVVPVIAPAVPSPQAQPAPVVIGLDDGRPARRSRRGLMIALVAAPVVVLAAGAVWWVASRSTPGAAVPAPTVSAASAVPVAPSPPRPGPTSSATPPVGSAPGTAATTDSLPVPPPPAEATSVVPTPTVPVWRPPPGTALPNAPAPMARPADKRKYEPEGI